MLLAASQLNAVKTYFRCESRCSIRPRGFTLEIRNSGTLSGIKVGNCHSLAHRPAAGRCSISQRLPRQMAYVHRCSSGTGDFCLRRGIRCCLPVFRARQFCRNGHPSQDGFRGVQTVAPSSIIAELKSPGCLAGTSCPASRHNSRTVFGSRTSDSIPCSRQRTRATLPSRIGSGLPNAIDAIAPAV